jgi:uncharacterized protein GlcG (DUF336 family)
MQVDQTAPMKTISVPSITAAAARELVAAARSNADAMGVTVVIHVADAAGHPVAMERMDHSPLFSVEIARKKAWTAAASGTTTRDLAIAFNGSPALLHGVAGNVDALITVGGGVPIRVGDSVAGALGVSGASEEQDHEIATRAVSAVFG